MMTVLVLGEIEVVVKALFNQKEADCGESGGSNTGQDSRLNRSVLSL